MKKTLAFITTIAIMLITMTATALAADAAVVFTESELRLISDADAENTAVFTESEVRELREYEQKVNGIVNIVRAKKGLGPLESTLTDSEMCVVRAFELKVLELVNIERAKHNLHPLVWSNEYAYIARAHSVDLALSNRLGHTGSDGSSPSGRIARENLDVPYTYSNENCVAGGGIPKVAVAMWMDSPGHRAAILNKSSTHAGVGMCGSIGTMMFGRTTDPNYIKPAPVDIPTETVPDASAETVPDASTATPAPARPERPAAVATGEFVIVNSSTADKMIVKITNGKAYSNINITTAGSGSGSLNGLTYTKAKGSNDIVVTVNGVTKTVSPGETVTLNK